MGWDWHNARNVRNGKIDRVAEVERDYNWGDENKKVKALKSSLVGSVVYSAIEVVYADGKRDVVGVVTLTQTNMRDHFNFGSKHIDESMGPCECKCPKSILDMLTPTKSVWANEWREKCRAFHNSKRKVA